MMRFASLTAFVRHLETLPARVREGEERGLDHIGRMFVAECVALIGQEVESWAPLAAQTVLRKEALGQTGRISATDPLYARGDLRLSFSYELEPHRLRFGSDNPVMFYHEHGTSRMPPRSVVGPVTAQHGQEAADVLANFLTGALAGLDGPRRPIPEPPADAG